MYVSVDEPTSPNEPDSVENLLQQADNIDNNNDPPPAIVKAEDQPVYAGVTIPVAEDVSTEETPDVTEDPPAEAAAEETAVEDAPGIYSSEFPSSLGPTPSHLFNQTITPFPLVRN